LIKIIKPVEEKYFKITSPFGIDRMIPGYDHPKKHNGIDIGCKNIPLICVAGGRIIYTGNDEKGFGNWILQRTYFEKQFYFFIYAHLSRIGCGNNQEVKQGDFLGVTGNSGHSTGAHLHFLVLFWSF